MRLTGIQAAKSAVVFALLSRASTLSTAASSCMQFHSFGLADDYVPSVLAALGRLTAADLVGAGSALERVARVVSARASNVCAVCAPVQRAALVAALRRSDAIADQHEAVSQAVGLVGINGTGKQQGLQAADAVGTIGTGSTSVGTSDAAGSSNAANSATVGGAGFGAASGGRVREASSIAEVFDEVMTAW
jgi:hypothetical protein